MKISRTMYIVLERSNYFKIGSEVAGRSSVSFSVTSLHSFTHNNLIQGLTQYCELVLRRMDIFFEILSDLNQAVPN